MTRMSTSTSSTDLQALLGDDADSLLGYTAKAFPAEHLTLPGPDYLEPGLHRQRPSPDGAAQPRARVFDHGRLGGTGYLSILPVDQGIEHSAAASFAKNPAYFDPANICELAIAGDCNAVATTLGTSASVSRRYVHKIPFIVKLNHNDFLHYPNTYDQIMFGHVQQASDLGAVGVGATIYFGSDEADRQIRRCPRPSPRPTGSGCSPCCGATCATPAFKKDGTTTTSRPTSPARPTTWA
jgi:class I fructose-bisphosphate aldolase